MNYLISGASGGIGKAILKELYNTNDNFIVLYNSKKNFIKKKISLVINLISKN